MELAESIDESADDMTAADTAPRPMNVMNGGHRYCITIGRIIFSSPCGIGMRLLGRSVWYQSARDTDTTECHLTHAVPYDGQNSETKIDFSVEFSLSLHFNSHFLANLGY